MGRDRQRGDGSAGSARSLLAGASLLAVGGCLGIVIGSLLDAPRLLLHRLQGPVQSVALDDPVDPQEALPTPEALPEDLAEYRALRTGRPPSPPLREVESPAGPPPAEPAAVSTAPATPPPSVGARPAGSGAAPRAEQLIAEIASRRGATPGSDQGERTPAPAPIVSPRSTRVVQVGAFADTRSAQVIVERLAKLGFDSYLSDTHPEGKYRYRVRVRPGAGADVEELARDLKGHGFKVWITKE